MSKKRDLELWTIMAVDKKPATVIKFLNAPNESSQKEVDDVAYLLLGKIIYECLNHNRISLSYFASSFKPFSYSSSFLKKDYSDSERCMIVRQSKELAALFPATIKTLYSQELIKIYKRSYDTMIGANYNKNYILESTEKGIIKYLKKAETFPGMWEDTWNEIFCMEHPFIPLTCLVSCSSFVRDYYKKLGIEWRWEIDFGWYIDNKETQAAIQQGLFAYLRKNPSLVIAD